MNKFLFFILFYSFSYSQSPKGNQQDDEASYKKCVFFINTNKDSLKFYINKLQRSNDICYRTTGDVFEAKLAYFNKEYTKTETICLETLKKIEHENDECFTSIKISLYTRLFWLKKNLGAYNEAYHFLNKQSEIIYSISPKNDFFYAKELTLKNHLAIIKSELGLYDETLKILKSHLPNLNEEENKDSLKDYHSKKYKANVLNSIGNTYFSLANKKHNATYLDSAATYYQKSFEVSKSFIPLHKDSEIIYTFKKVKVLVAQKKYKDALKLINQYKKINASYDYHQTQYFHKTLCFYNLKKSDSTILYANKIINNKEDKFERNNLITLYDILSNEYHNSNNLDSAYKYSKLTMQHYELAEKNKEKTFQLLYENDFEKAKKLNREIKIEEQKKQNNLFILFALVLIFVFCFMFFYLKNKQKKKQLIINELKNKTKEKETIKKEYNINKELESQILDEIKKINTELIFLKSDFSINMIAERINTNSTYVSFIFNKHYKESFKQYYTKTRIDYIVEKLKKEPIFRKYSIQGIAEEIGYTNASAFTRAFKKQMNITPSAFLKTLDY